MRITGRREVRQGAGVSGPKRGSGQRSGLYSEAKFTNWSPFDPFFAEARKAREDRKPFASVPLPTGAVVPIFEWPLQPGFSRPFSAEDVRRVLSDIPSEHLEDLVAVHLLGGTAKERKSHQVRYGLYFNCRVYLHPLPERFLNQRWDPPPKPSVIREYARFGARFVCDAGEWRLCFEPESLRLFCLLDVLLHEVGHHVDRDVRPNPGPASERYAKWFANYLSNRLLGGSD